MLVFRVFDMKIVYLLLASLMKLFRIFDIRELFKDEFLILFNVVPTTLDFVLKA